MSEDLMEEMKLSDNREISDLAEKMEKEEEARAQIDRYWIITFILVLFFIHLGRMGFDRSFLGILSPLVAVIETAESKVSRAPGSAFRPPHPVTVMSPVTRHGILLLAIPSQVRAPPVTTRVSRALPSRLSW